MSLNFFVRSAKPPFSSLHRKTSHILFVEPSISTKLFYNLAIRPVRKMRIRASSDDPHQTANLTLDPNTSCPPFLCLQQSSPCRWRKLDNFTLKLQTGMSL